MVEARSKASEIDFDVVVVGAGFAGIYMLHRLRQAGFRTLVVEAGADVGGTWYWNRYPGARCDGGSLFYSYGFDEELEQEWDWTERYPRQDELQAYLQHVVERFDLRRDMRFGLRVIGATFDDERRSWAVQLDSGETVTCHVCIMATGCLSTPLDPKFPGIEQYGGRVITTSNWPEAIVDFAGQRVAVIGTGSSGIQVIPIIAEDAASLHVFQRTPNYIVPAHNGPLAPEVVADVKANYPRLRQLGRESGGGVWIEPPTKSAFEVTPDERERIFEERWLTGGVPAFSTAFNDLRTNHEASDAAGEFIRNKIRSIVKDPVVAEMLCPKDYLFGAKRVCCVSGYWESFNRENVSLVDLKATPIDRFTEKGIQTADARYEFDIIVLATGFDAMTGTLLKMDVRGAAGESLRDTWANGPVNLLGLQIPGFPNLFMITGPGSPSVVSSMVVSIEQHVEWIGDLLVHMRELGYTTVEADDRAAQDWMQHVDEVGSHVVQYNARSWYTGANVPGKPQVFMPYVGGVGRYRQECQRVADAGYEGFHLK